VPRGHATTESFIEAIAENLRAKIEHGAATR
jgi:hypothetical protein